mmetsp:Transcript_10648/g.39745  ORF Transcript_10648/g.39745 Transcript_10648/m.39745 type:complete len:294 (-) Transcript_10648:140-1021(-)|eukprot:CAMPEP_0117450894 /NCGR_PEP_ID=MMETSP0759-20121206/8715_1 /TAXON_ID=63605 /ORGANISM="Percolomonas cosmopolitus, Strain WS" /LENGTH=293 /DNA_ID=CAMNT_0005243453 /DNA_START=107 /DNA_END=988 /DNA_ORIENTATION=+
MSDSSLISVYNDQIEDLKESINGQILKLRRLPSNEQEKLANEIIEQLKKAKSIFRKFKKEVKMVPVSEKDRWERKKKELLDDLTKLSIQFNNAKEMADRSELLGDASAEKKPSDEVSARKGRQPRTRGRVEVREVDGKKRVRNEALEEELFKDVFAMQDQSLSIVQRLLQKADESSELATDTQQVLAAQREQLEHIDEEMDRLGSNITRAGKEITSFMRRMATDGLILVLCALATCVAILSIILVIVCKVGVCKLVLDAINKAKGDDTNQNARFIDAAEGNGWFSSCRATWFG